MIAYLPTPPALFIIVYLIFQGFTLEFHFSPNDHFTDRVLTKSYEMRSELDENDPFSFEGPEIVACQGYDTLSQAINSTCFIWLNDRLDSVIGIE